MKALVLYDSYFGNTKIIAETIAKELGDNTALTSVTDFKTEMLNGVNLLIVGSPIRGWKPSERMQVLLSTFKKDQLKGIKATTFDTRVRIFHGDAAKAMAKKLKESGAEIIINSESFDVKGQEGPLFEKEVEKAVNWAISIKQILTN